MKLKKTRAVVLAALITLSLASCEQSSVSGGNDSAPKPVGEAGAATGVDYTGKISVGWSNMAVMADGSLWMWGLNHDPMNNPNLIDESETRVITTPVKKMDGVKQVVTKYTFCLALKEDGTLWGWGHSYYLGLGEVVDSSQDNSEPKLIMEDVTFIDAGTESVLAIKEDKSLWVWGWGYGIGLGHQDVMVPTKIMDDVVYAEAAGQSGARCFAIKTDGSLWGTGNNDYGELDVNLDEGQFDYVKIMDDVACVSSGDNHTLILKKDGSLLTVGANHRGQLGNGEVSSVYQGYELLPIMNDVAYVEAFEDSSFAIKTDGTLMAWGRNEHFGTVGVGTEEEEVATPTAIMSNVSFVVTNGADAMCVRTDGSVWGWGMNREGKFGVPGAVGEIRSPVKIFDLGGYNGPPLPPPENGGNPPVNPSPTVVSPSPPEEEETYTVTFDLARGIHLGGGALSQTVPSGGSAQAPVTRRGGHEFAGWDTGFTNVQSDITVTARWEQVPPRFPNPDPLLSIETLAGFHSIIALSLTQTEAYYNIPVDEFRLTSSDLFTIAPAVPYILYAWEDFSELYPGYRIPEGDFDTLLWETCFAGIDYFRTLSTENYARFEDGYIVFNDVAADMVEQVKLIGFDVEPEINGDDIAVTVIMYDTATGQTITWLIEGVLNDSNMFAPYDFSSITLLGIDAPEDAPSVNTGNISLSVDSTVYAPGSLMGVTVTGITQEMISDYAFVAIYNAGATHGEWQEYQYPQEFDNFLLFIAPDTPGEYEIRLYRKDGEYTDETFMLSVPFSVA